MDRQSSRFTTCRGTVPRLVEILVCDGELRLAGVERGLVFYPMGSEGVAQQGGDSPERIVGVRGRGVRQRWPPGIRVICEGRRDRRPSQMT